MARVSNGRIINSTFREKIEEEHNLYQPTCPGANNITFFEQSEHFPWHSANKQKKHIQTDKSVVCTYIHSQQISTN